MAGLADFRAQHPEYNDMSDGDLSNALYSKYYSDIPRPKFDTMMAAPSSGPQVPLPEGSRVDPMAGLPAKPAPPTSELLGLEEGLARPVENFNSGVNWATNKLGFSLNPLLKSLGGQGLLQENAAVENDRAQAEKTSTPGAAGKFVGTTLGSLPALAVTKNPFLLGAAQGALTTDKTTPAGVLGDTAVGAVAGKVGEAGTNALGAIVSPHVSPIVKYLLSKGVKLTPGQIAGGFVHRVEDAATSMMLPFISDAQGRSSQSYMKATVNEALGQIGQGLPDAVPAGHASVAAAQGAFDDAYANLRSKLSVTRDGTWDADTKSLKNLVTNLPQQYQDQFNTQLSNINNKFGLSGKITGDTFKELDETLGKEVKDWGGNNASGPLDRKYSDAIRELQATLHDAAGRSNPDLAAKLDKTDAGYAMLTRVERAAANTKDGVFTPAQFRAAVVAGDTTVRHRASAAGDALMQPLATAGESVLPRTIPDSGTAARRYLQAVTGAALFGAHSAPVIGPYINPLAVGAVGLGLAPYTKVGGDLFRGAMTSRPAGSDIVRQGLEDMAPLGATTIANWAVQHKDAGQGAQ